MLVSDNTDIQPVLDAITELDAVAVPFLAHSSAGEACQIAELVINRGIRAALVHGVSPEALQQWCEEAVALHLRQLYVRH